MVYTWMSTTDDPAGMKVDENDTICGPLPSWQLRAVKRAFPRNKIVSLGGSIPLLPENSAPNVRYLLEPDCNVVDKFISMTSDLTPTLPPLHRPVWIVVYDPTDARCVEFAQHLYERRQRVAASPPFTAVYMTLREAARMWVHVHGTVLFFVKQVCDVTNMFKMHPRISRCFINVETTCAPAYLPPYMVITARYMLPGTTEEAPSSQSSIAVAIERSKEFPKSVFVVVPPKIHPHPPSQ